MGAVGRLIPRTRRRTPGRRLPASANLACPALRVDSARDIVLTGFTATLHSPPRCRTVGGRAALGASPTLAQVGTKSVPTNRRAGWDMADAPAKPKPPARQS